MADTDINWADKVWNPTLGCVRVSTGCGAATEGGCYAERLAFRLAAMGRPEYQGLTHRLPNGAVRWTGKVICLPERLAIPLTWKKPARVFVDSMSDLFHEDVPDEFIEQVFGVMALADWHVFQVLTKRPDRMQCWLSEYRKRWPSDVHATAALACAGERGIGHERLSAAMRVRLGLDNFGPWPLPNVWLGTSVEDQRAADERIPLLLQTPAAVRFLSAEPLLSAIDLSPWLSRGMACDGMCDEDAPGTCQRPEHRLRRPNWIIAGGESGPSYRPMYLDWARSLRDQCQAAGVAYFFKQIGGRTHAAGGRLLDGVEWNQFPEPARETASASR